MAAGAVVHLVCAASSQPSQKERIPAVLQTNTGIERPATNYTLCRYNSLMLLMYKGTSQYPYLIRALLNLDIVQTKALSCAL